jgi:dUTP pyrophosphatase
MDLQNDSEFQNELKKLFDEIKNFDPTGDNQALDSLQEDLGFNINDFQDFIENGLTKKIISYKKLNEKSKEPTYAYPTDSGFDFYSTEEIVLPPFGRALVPTGLCFDLPVGYEMQVRTKSGLAINQGLMVLNSPGTIDRGYQGEIKVIVFNTNNHELIIPKGMKVGQGVVCPVLTGEDVLFDQVNEFEPKERGDNGFGSTGI